MALRTYRGEFNSARPDRAAGGFVLTGEVATDRSTRPVELTLSRERLQSLVVNLTADGDLFPRDLTDTVSQVRKLQLLSQLGVPEAIARELTGTADDGPVTLAIEARMAEHLTRATDSVPQS